MVALIFALFINYYTFKIMINVTKKNYCNNFTDFVEILNKSVISNIVNIIFAISSMIKLIGAM